MPRMFKPQKQIIEAQLPNAAQRLQLLELTINTLTRAGYVYIGMDHFALPGDELVKAQRERSLHRNFQGYSTRAECDLIGLGVSSIGKVADTYAQNARTLPEYYAALTAGQLPIQRGITLNRDDQLRHAVIQEIMCHGELRFAELSARWIEFRDYFAAELSALQLLAEMGCWNWMPMECGSHRQGVCCCGISPWSSMPICLKRQRRRSRRQSGLTVSGSKLNATSRMAESPGMRLCSNVCAPPIHRRLSWHVTASAPDMAGDLALRSNRRTRQCWNRGRESTPLRSMDRRLTMK
jgi:hypothetical protein